MKESNWILINFFNDLDCIVKSTEFLNVKDELAKSRVLAPYLIHERLLEWEFTEHCREELLVMPWVRQHRLQPFKPAHTQLNFNRRNFVKCMNLSISH